MGEKLFNRHFVLCLIMQFWFMLMFNMTFPLIAQHIVDMGASTAVAGFVAGIFAIIALAMRPFSGYFADNYHNRMLLIVSYVLTIAAFFGYALAPNVAVMLVFRVIHAAGLCLQTTIVPVIAMAFMPKDRIVEGVGYIGVGAQLGIALGPSIGVLIANAFGIRGTVAAAGILMIVTVILLFFIPIAPPVKKEKTRKMSIHDFVSVEALPLAITLLAFSCCSGLSSALLVLVGNVRAIPGITIFFLVSSLGICAARPFSGKLVDRKGLNILIPFTFVSEIICCLLIAFAHNFPMILASAFFRIGGQGVAQSSLQGQVMKDAGPEKKGVANSTMYAGIDVGQGLGAIVGGAIADVAGYEGAFMFGPFMILIGIITYLVWFRRDKKKKQQEAAE